VSKEPSALAEISSEWAIPVVVFPHLNRLTIVSKCSTSVCATEGPSNIDERREAMRFLIKIELPVERANTLAKEGALGKKIQSILEDQKPEAAYFAAYNGKRAAFVFLDLQEPSQLPAIAEPWFLAFNADIQAIPAMNLEDLMKAGQGIQQAVEKYG
jgi:hypothetical protein